LAVIPGDGIGQEVTPVALEALRKALSPKGVEISHTEFNLGADRYLKTGETLTESDKSELAKHDAILLGAVGDPRVPSGVLERGLLLNLRFAFDHHINVRPSKSFAGVEGVLTGNPKFDIDAATIHMVADPAKFDVIVTDNLFGDIITDLAAAIGGGIGLAASANLNPTGNFPSMFEPVHGSAPDIAGKNLADPTAAILSAGLLAEQLGYNIAAEQINLAVSDYIAQGRQEKSTEKIAESILSRI
jgi:isocitrate/isopropylmalate dehydrogenase